MSLQGAIDAAVARGDNSAWLRRAMEIEGCTGDQISDLKNKVAKLLGLKAELTEFLSGTESRPLLKSHAESERARELRKVSEELAAEVWEGLNNPDPYKMRDDLTLSSGQSNEPLAERISGLIQKAIAKRQPGAGHNELSDLVKTSSDKWPRERVISDRQALGRSINGEGFEDSELVPG